MDIAGIIAKELDVRTSQVEAAIKLLDEGNTVPFISRYRKEATGGLNDEKLRDLSARLEYLRGLQDRKDAVISSIESQGKMTDKLKKSIDLAMTLVEVEDLYRPYKQKKRTRAMIAREKGLEPLAAAIMNCGPDADLDRYAEDFINEEREVGTADDAIKGACDIIAEDISDSADIRSAIRKMTEEKGLISSKMTGDHDPDAVYENYYDFSEKVGEIPGHRILALNRGEKEKALTVTVIFPEDEIISYTNGAVIKTENKRGVELIKSSVEDSLKRLILPSIEREIRSALTERAEDGAIDVFGKNLHELLMQPPIRNRVVLGWDPAYRTGCKISIVDETGKVLDTTVIFPTPPQNRVEESKAVIKHLIEKYNVSLIALGNGTASRESEQIISEIIKEIPVKVEYVIVNEAGASVYSASALATEEFPNFDVGQRSATSMARRLEDPLSELVKIDPKSLGVGQYQHDINQKKLSEKLGSVVETCVNSVGVDLNTASFSLLEYVSGMNKTTARNIVAYREENGRFKDRKELLNVAKLGKKAFEQCAGFLRIPGGDEPLDNTSVHPESYEVARKLLQSLGYSEDDIKSGGIHGIKKEIKDVNSTAESLGVGLPTLNDIISELEKPGRDPRDEMPKPLLRSDVLTIDDLKPGMVLKGTVRNIVDFGAFVDIGVHQDGLVHISHITDKYIKHPLEVLSVGEVVDVEVLDVDPEKKRIALSMLIGHENKSGDKAVSSDKTGRPKDTRRSSGHDKKNNKKTSGSRPKTGKHENKHDASTSLGDILKGIKI
jgi:uncharacterized protein